MNLIEEFNIGTMIGFRRCLQISTYRPMYRVIPMIFYVIPCEHCPNQSNLSRKRNGEKLIKKVILDRHYNRDTTK
jgi:nitrate reductase beta subunit